MTVLSRAALAGLPADIVRPDYGDVQVGIVHFGPGAFHRAHQAAYVDALLPHDPRWGIAAVSLRTRGTVDALAAQDGLYTLAVRDVEPNLRVIGAHRRFLGPEDATETLALLADPAVRLVTTTVTEKGYCLGSDGTLDMTHPDVIHDLAGIAGGSAVPRSVIGWIVAGLAARHGAGLAPFVPMPCDNLAGNGAKLHAALVAFADAREHTGKDRHLADWIAGEVRVPSTMVDSITPASDAALLTDVAGALGVEDRAPVQREAFTQWVIEDVGAFGHGAYPDLASVGATVTRDVAGYEQAKLRILNGAHSTLAYAGLLRGHASVAGAMGDSALVRFVDAMIAREIAAVLPPVTGLDLDAYRAAVLARFRNPAIVHRLDQIAIDGSQKLPYRLGDTLAAHREAGWMPMRVVAAFGCWVAFLVQRARAGIPIVDPLGSRLADLAAEGSGGEVASRLIAAGIGLPATAARDDALLTQLRAAADAAVAGDWASVFASGQ